MDEIAGFRARGVFAPRAPADFAGAGQDIGDRLLLSMMMDACTGSRLDLEQPAPQRRLDAELRRDRGQSRSLASVAVPGSNAAGLTMRIGGYSVAMT
jgi:hypothetical protein